MFFLNTELKSKTHTPGAAEGLGAWVVITGGMRVDPWPVMVPAVGVKLQSGFMQQGLAGSLNRRHSAGRLGNLAHLES